MITYFIYKKSSQSSWDVKSFCSFILFNLSGFSSCKKSGFICIIFEIGLYSSFSIIIKNYILNSDLSILFCLLSSYKCKYTLGFSVIIISPSKSFKISVILLIFNWSCSLSYNFSVVTCKFVVSNWCNNASHLSQIKPSFVVLHYFK